MKEQLVSFEIAKLAYKKGFNHIAPNCYGDNMVYQLPEGILINALQGNTVTGYILAPTQSLLQKWIREKYDINIEVGMQFKVWFYSINKIPYDSLTNSDIKGKTGFLCYEEALEEGLFEALKLIPNEKETEG